MRHKKKGERQREHFRLLEEWEDVYWDERADAVYDDEDFRALVERLKAGSPESWSRIEYRARRAQVERVLREGYSQPDSWAPVLRLWKCECVERVLWLYEKRHPEGKRPRQALEATRAFLRGECSEDELEAIGDTRDDYWHAADDAALDASPNGPAGSSGDLTERNAEAAAAYAT